MAEGRQKNNENDKNKDMTRERVTKAATQAGTILVLGIC